MAIMNQLLLLLERATDEKHIKKDERWESRTSLSARELQSSWRISGSAEDFDINLKISIFEFIICSDLFVSICCANIATHDRKLT